MSKGSREKRPRPIISGFIWPGIGIYLFLIFMMQTATFFFLSRFGTWRFRRWPLYALQAGMGAAVVLVSFTGFFPLVLLSSIPLGMGLGLAYHASITYSLASSAGRGERAGIHESLLGAGNLTIPLTGGLLASAFGDLRIPYWYCGIIVAAGLLAQEILWRRRRDSGRENG